MYNHVESRGLQNINRESLKMWNFTYLIYLSENTRGLGRENPTPPAPAIKYKTTKLYLASRENMKI